MTGIEPAKDPEKLIQRYPAKRGFDYLAVREAGESKGSVPEVLRSGTFQSSPFINFRWVKAPGEVYGRSPVMKALPDIKTANKVVELILKNASIAVMGGGVDFLGGIPAAFLCCFGKLEIKFAGSR